MRLVRLLVCLLAIAALLAPAAHALPRAKARLTACTPSHDQAERTARFEGDMRGIPGAARLQMKFRLQIKEPGSARWTRVAAPGWGAWTTADPGIQRYVYTKTVEELVVPARYRAAIAFRWTTADGRLLLRLRRHTPVCSQPDLRPDLAPVDVRMQPGSRSDLAVYAVSVRNTGAADADAFRVVLEREGVRTVLGGRAGLAVGSLATIRAEAPACRPGERITIVVEPESEAAEDRDPEDDALTLACPGIQPE